MPARGKSYRESTGKIERGRLYTPQEAVALVKETARAKFDETVEAAVRLGVDVRHADQMVRGALVLPHGTGKDATVLAFARGDKAREAQEAGADYVGVEELAEQIEGGWLDFDVAVAVPDVMNVVGKLGRILGPRGLMPNPKSGTVTPDVGEAVREAKAGKIEYRTDRGGIVHAPIGKVSFDEAQLLENLYALCDALIKARPAAAKGQYLRGITLAATMGPGVDVSPQRVLTAA